MANLTGQSIGRYHILEQLGEGGMATVYKAYDTRLEREVAVKVLRTDQFIPAQLQMVLQRFEREAKSLAKLSHPNIVNILDYGEHEGMPYLVMEYLPGGTLKQKLGQAIPWQEALRTLIPVAQGLAYAHQRGIIHRDVKPANILLKESGTPVLTDFGIAKLLEAGEGHTLTGSGVGIGTPEYMAPEQGIGAKVVDARADIYSLGIVLYEMVTGRKPYIADTPMAVVLKQMTDPLPRPTEFTPDLSEGVEHLLLKALAKQPDDRFADMNAMLAAMENLLMEMPTIPVQPAPPQETVAAAPPAVVHVPAAQPEKKAPARARFSPKVILAVAGVLVIAVLAIFGLPRMQKQTPAVPAETVTPTSTFPTKAAQINVPTSLPTQTETPPPAMTATPPPPVAATPTPIPLAWTQVFAGEKLKIDTVTTAILDPSNPSIMYAGTQNSGIYKSIDAGASWQPVNNGLGIAKVDSLVIDPSDPDILYAGVVSRGVYKTTDGAKQWQHASKELPSESAAWISQVVMDPQDSRHLYLNEFGHKYETKDGGLTWQPLGTSGCPANLTNLLIHPKNSQILFVTEAGSPSCKAGVYRTKDGGKTWTNLGVVEELIAPGKFKIDYQTGEFLYVYSSEAPLLYTSQNGGEVWEKNTNTVCDILAVHLTDGKTIYCASGGVEISTDGGKTWRDPGSPIHTWGFETLVLSPQSENALYVGGYRGIQISKSGGTTWSISNQGLGGCPPELMLAPSQNGGLYVYEKGRDPYCLGSNDGSLYKTADQGKTWKTLTNYQVERSQSMAFDADGKSIYWNGSRSGYDFQDPQDLSSQTDEITANPFKAGNILSTYFFQDKQFIAMSTNRGATWQDTTPVEMSFGARFFFDQERGQVIYGLQPKHDEGPIYFNYDLKTGERTFGLLPTHDEGVIYRSMDGGKNWAKCGSPIPADNPSLVPREVALFDKSRVYLATQGGGLLVSSDDCKSWIASNAGLGSLYVNTVAVDPNNPATVYAGTEAGAYVSYDSGQTWGVISDGLVNSTIIYSIVVDRASNVFAATSFGVFKLEKK